MNIMLDDLKPNKQKELLDFFRIKSVQEAGYDILPLFVISDIQSVTDTGRQCYDRLVISFLKTV